MASKKIYISGKVTGTNDYMFRFAAVEQALKALFPGVSVVNPVKVNAALPKDTTYDEYMQMSFVMLGMCNTIFMMSGWEESDGARKERELAKELGLDIIYQDGVVKNENAV